MSARWSSWHSIEGGRSRRVWVDPHNRPTYLQYDNDRTPVYDTLNNILSRDVTQHLLPPIDATPRSGFAGPPPERTDQRDTGAASSNTNFQAVSNANQRSNMRSRPEDDDEDQEGLDDIAPLPQDPDQRVLLDSAMDRRPLSSQATGALMSIVDTTQSRPPGFFERHSKFFALGVVFIVLWVEATSTTAKGKQKDDEIYSTLRPMVVVSKRKAHSICAPVFSYNNRGIGKPGLVESEIQHHAVIHMEGTTAAYVPEENDRKKLMKLSHAFTVEGPAGGPGLSTASRVRFDTTYPVRCNLKVREIGRIIKEHRPRLQARWKAANSS